MSHDLEPLSPDVESMLRAERSYEAESDARRMRVMTRLTSTAAAVGLVASVTVGAAHAAPVTWLVRLARLARTKAAIAVGALAIGGAGGGVVGHELGQRAAEKRAAAVVSAAPPAPPVVPVQLSPSPSASSIDVLALPSSAPVIAPSPRPHSSVAPRETGDEDLAAELALVQMARTSLARQNFSGALDATEQHGRKFPNGHLAEERESLAIQALVGAGRDSEARARAARFRARYPHSLLLPAVEAAVGAP